MLLNILFFALGTLVTILTIFFQQELTELGNRIKKVFNRMNIDVLSPEWLQNRGLLFDDRDIIHNKNYFKSKNKVYWPVVPTDTPNIIHAAFINHLKYLDKLGFQVVVFIFDDYYFRISEKGEKEIRHEVKCFRQSLKKMGLKQIRHNIVLESKFIYKRKVFKYTLDILTELSLADIDHISNEKKLNYNDVFIKNNKHIHNLTYFCLSDSGYGIVISGVDDKKLWDIFWEKTKISCEHRCLNIYIPLMKGITNKKTNVLDKANNITFIDSFDDIKGKVISTLQLSFAELVDLDVGFFYAFKYIFFLNEIDVIINISETESKLFKDYISFFEYVYNNKDNDYIILSISDLIYSLFH